MGSGVSSIKGLFVKTPYDGLDAKYLTEEKAKAKNQVTKYFVEKMRRDMDAMVNKHKRQRAKNRKVGISLGLFSICAYFYTMYAVQQETILEEVEELAEEARKREETLQKLKEMEEGL